MIALNDFNSSQSLLNTYFFYDCLIDTFIKCIGTVTK